MSVRVKVLRERYVIIKGAVGETVLSSWAKGILLEQLFF